MSARWICARVTVGAQEIVAQTRMLRGPGATPRRVRCPRVTRAVTCSGPQPWSRTSPSCPGMACVTSIAMLLVGAAACYATPTNARTNLPSSVRRPSVGCCAGTIRACRLDAVRAWGDESDGSEDDPGGAQERAMSGAGAAARRGAARRPRSASPGHLPGRARRPGASSGRDRRWEALHPTAAGCAPCAGDLVSGR